MMDKEFEHRLRLSAFSWLQEQVSRYGEVLPWAVLQKGFTFGGERVPLVSMQGIFKPRLCRLPLTIRTSPSDPYGDTLSSDGFLKYRYFQTDPQHRSNKGLRTAMTERVPLIYLHGHKAGRYHVIWPVYVVGDDAGSLTFTVEADDAAYLAANPADGLGDEVAEPRREYVTTSVRRRIHQHAFREHVLSAYAGRCALCQLRHRELLDAAHIVPDSEPEGVPRVANGLALCKIHHAAFDAHILTVDQDFRVYLREDILEERDGPMLLHGLQELHRKKIYVPRRVEDRPDREGLVWRWERFWGKAG